MKVSPNFDLSKVETGGIEDKIDVYEDRIKGWFLEPARILEEKGSGHAGFAILLLAVSFVEGYGILLRGEDSQRQSKIFFKAGLREMFKGLETRHSQKIVDKALNGIYEQIRCGLAHYGMTKEKVTLSGDYQNPIDVVFDANKNITHIMVNPHRFLDKMEESLGEYIERLRDPEENVLRSNFEKAWALLYE